MTSNFLFIEDEDEEEYGIDFVGEQSKLVEELIRAGMSEYDARHEAEEMVFALHMG